MNLRRPAAVALAAAAILALDQPPAPADSPDRVGSDLDSGRRNAIVRASERVGPAVVTVSVLRTQLVESRRSPAYDEFFGPFFQGFRRRHWQRVRGLGSGVIVRDDGVVITNYHVVKGAERIRITLSDGRELGAEYLGGDELYDLAFLRIQDAADVPTAPIRSSDDLLIGEWVIAIGNPFGYLLDDPQPSVSVGVVSGTSRDIRSDSDNSQTIYKDMIQTDAAINPGNSGGALVNALGEVIGINTFILSRSGGSHGVGFAIPISRVERILDEVLDHGKVREVWVGVHVQEIPTALAESLDLESTDGVIVASVDPGSPAAESDIRRADVILSIGGSRIRNFEDARRALYGVMVGDEIDFVVRRGEGDVSTRRVRVVERG